MPFKEQRMSIEDQIKINQINVEQQHRIAVDMSDKTYVKNYDEDFYSLKRTKEENKLISKALSKTVVSNMVLSKETKAHLRNLRSRNKSHILLNQHKLFRDSELMTNVKDSIHLLEQSLVTGKLEEDSLNLIEQNYKDAIRDCMTYCDKKNPRFPKGKERKRLVANRLRALKKELGILRFARKYNTDNPDPEVKSPLDLLELGRIHMPDQDALLPDEEFLKDDHIIEKEEKKEENKKEEPIKEEKKEEIKKEEPVKQEEIKKEEPIKQEEIKKEEPIKQEEIKKEESIKQEEIKKEEPIKQEEIKKEEPIKQEEIKKEEPIKQEEIKKEEPIKQEEIKKEEPIKKEKNEGLNDGNKVLVKIKWLEFKDNGDASWQRYAKNQQRQLKNHLTNKMIKDKVADQQVIDALCKNWTYLSSAGKHMRSDVGAGAYDDYDKASSIIDEIVSPMFKAFSMERKTVDDTRKIVELCAQRYFITGDMHEFLFRKYFRGKKN